MVQNFRPVHQHFKNSLLDGAQVSVNVVDTLRPANRIGRL